MSVSRKSFLEHLSQTDFIWFGHIKDDWPAIVEESQQTVIGNPQCWSHLAVDESDADPWDDIGNEYVETLKHYRAWGYNAQNTRVWETTSAMPKIQMAWEDRVAKHLPLTAVESKPTLQTPGNIIPWHQDKFFSFKRQHGDTEFIVRFVVFLRDWATGHFLQAGDSVICHWKAGDVITWMPQRMHLSVNVGIENKWTVNYTGILKENFEWDQDESKNR